MPINGPASYFYGGGSALGFALPAAVGVALGPVGGDLQRDHHRDVDPAGAARCAIHAQQCLELLSRNLYVYGVGSIIAPFIGIKLIDLVIQFIPGMS